MHCYYPKMTITTIAASFFFIQKALLFNVYGKEVLTHAEKYARVTALKCDQVNVNINIERANINDKVS